MFSVIRKRLTYANVTMTLALVLAISGGAYAASKYLITSTKQISPKVLTALKGKPGPAGPAGTAGAQGAPGPVGPAGAEGPAGARGETGPEGKEGKEGKAGKNGTTGFTETLPSEKTETGVWGTSGPPGPLQGGAAEGVSAPISFDIPLKERANVNIVGVGATLPQGCEGTASAPVADPGNLCVFVFEENNVGVIFPVSEPGFLEETGKTGEMIWIVAGGPGAVGVRGTWAVTAK